LVAIYLLVPPQSTSSPPNDDARSTGALTAAVHTHAAYSTLGTLGHGHGSGGSGIAPPLVAVPTLDKGHLALAAAGRGGLFPKKTVYRNASFNSSCVSV
jgi:hypothetical protein